MKRVNPRRRHKVRKESKKMLTGISGLDEITRGGLPRHRNTVILGGPGCGKTVLALQALVTGARDCGEPGIFVAFEENTDQIISNAASFGWNLVELERKKLFFLDARTRPEHVSAGDFDIIGLLASIDVKVKEMGAKRIVFDSIDMLLSLLDNVSKERLEMQRLLEWLLARGLTAIITSKLEGDSQPANQRYGFLQFVADCIVLLSQQTVESVARRELRVIKYRGSAFSENTAPMLISKSGIEVAHIGSTDKVFPVSTQRVSTGVARLDAMLGGGFYRGSSVLITGARGTAKSTLSGGYCAGVCRRGERALYVSFDEVAGEHARNMASVGIDLATHLKSGRLKIYSARSEDCSLEEHLVRIHSLVRGHRARHLVFDPLSSLFREGAQSSVQNTSERLLHMAKSGGITTISTSILSSADTRIEGTPLEVLTNADTWIHLSYAVQAGERNRALTIVKARGMKHSNQVRELVLSDNGVTLADVYTSGGEVLMGTMRREFEMRRIELAAHTLEETRRANKVGRYRSALGRSRSADLDVAPAKVTPRGRP